MESPTRQQIWILIFLVVIGLSSLGQFLIVLDVNSRLHRWETNFWKTIICDDFNSSNPICDDTN
jgi:hypothetical protein